MNRERYVAVIDIAARPGWPSRAALYEIIAKRGIKRFKFPGDKKTYVVRSELERALRTPEERK